MLPVRVGATLGLLGFSGTMTVALANEHKVPNSVEWLVIALIYATVASGVLCIWAPLRSADAPRSWPGLILERKRMEEELRVRDLRARLQGSARRTVLPPPAGSADV